MQKALILALLIGAFLLPRYVTAQENPGLQCPDGGTFQDHPELGQICSMPSPSGQIFTANGQGAPLAGLVGTGPSVAAAHSDLVSKGLERLNSNADNSGSSTWQSTDEFGQPITCSNSYTIQHAINLTEQRSGRQYYSYIKTTTSTISGPPRCGNSAVSDLSNTYNFWVATPTSTDNYCPPDNYPSLRNYHESGEAKICFAPALDEPPPPEECDDIVGNCEPDPECFPGGNGMEVCPKDPDETCDSYTHNGNIYYDCPAGCGFIEGSLYCTTEPDSDGEIPDLSNCFKVATGWACPSDSPTPDDNIDNPEKPLPDMTKGDFKQVNIGIETRLDGTNDLLSDLAAIGKANSEGLADLNSKSLAGNKKLDDIIKNTGATVDALTGDGESADLGDGATFRSEIANALGITGEETIEDLTVAEIDLDDFKGEFSWSIGSSQCPQPRAINMLGRTFYMDWDPFCQAFTIMGYLILAAAYFFSTLIAFKGK